MSADTGETVTTMQDLVAFAVQRAAGAGQPWALIGLAPFLSDEQRTAALDAASGWLTVCAIEDGNLRAVTLGSLARSVTGEYLVAAEAATYAIDDPAARARGLAAVAPHLPEPRGQAAIAAALTAVLMKPSGGDTLRRIALHELLPLVDQDQAAVVLDADAAELDSHSHSWLKSVAPYATPQRLAVAVADYLAPRRLGDDLTGARLPRYVDEDLAKLVPYLPAEQRTAAARSAVSLFGRIHDRDWGRGLAFLAQYLTAEQVDEAFRVADPHDHPLALCDGIEHLAPYLSGDRLDEAIAALLEVADEDHRSQALAGIAPHLGDIRIDQAVAAATGIGDPQLRAQALAAIVPHVPHSRRPAVVRTALDAVEMLTEADDRADQLIRLAAALPADQRAPVLTRAYTAVTATPDGSKQQRLVEELAHAWSA
ncbi:hypothetical protein [Dactylosporangium sp. CS-033363]|uniref:hypothetical protein n=1 Tax=Dactylosporangium sp. CS-033363 TaxID=3239935 RepID=UPI003D94F865